MSIFASHEPHNTNRKDEPRVSGSLGHLGSGGEEIAEAERKDITWRGGYPVARPLGGDVPR